MNGIERDTFGTTGDGQPVERFTLTNGSGAVLRLIALGATVTELRVRDRSGELSDIVLGFDDVPGYETNVPYFGCTVGRVANRISKGRFTLDGVEYQLAINEPPSFHLHGGDVGFNKRLWQADVVDRAEGPAVRFTYVSPDNEEAYPGELSVAVVYILTHEDGMRIEYEAHVDRPTPVNLTNHSYFNLSGHAAGSIREHVLQLHAREVTDTDSGPPGGMVTVVGTPLDFARARAIGERLDQVEGGYDHNYVLDHGGCDAPELSAQVYDPASGRVMEVHTTEPGVQLYTGNFLDGVPGKSGAVYQQHAGLCLETQHFPDSVNHPEYPSVILRPGQSYRQVTEYRFSTR